MSERPVVFDPSLVEQDLRVLYEAAVQRPRGPEDRLLRVALNQMARVKNGAPSTHDLEWMPSYPDLSDCRTTYVGADPNAKPSHRLVWREIVPEDPEEPIVRQAIALGERSHGAAYHLAGQRLGRPVGVPLSELRAMPEPIARPSRRVSYDPPTLRQDTPSTDGPGLGA